MNPMRLCLLAAVLLATLPPSANAQVELGLDCVTPRSILIDGQIESAEWSGARATTIAGTLRLLLLETQGDVFLAVATGTRTPRPVDIYLQGEDGEIFQLHASAQIGERHLPRAGWSDTIPAWRWGNHVQWLANEAKLDAQQPREAPFSQRTFGADGVEFQLRRARFPGRTWRLRVDVGVFPGNAGEYRFPAGASDDPATWAVVHLPTGS